MEKAGFVGVLNNILSQGVNVKIVSTDRHLQIRKLMREVYGYIEHAVDPWHLIKGMVKKLRAKSKKKGCEVICK